MSEVEKSATEIATEVDNNVEVEPKTPTKSTPSKRLTSFERARVEGEELLKALGGSLEGGRRTRSSTRGTPATPPPPEKRARVSTPRRSKKAKEEAAEKESSQDEADNASKAAAAEETTVVAENSSEEKNESVEKMEVDGASKVAESNSESAITKTVTESDEKIEATSTTAAADGDASQADTSDAAAPSTIEIDDSSDDSNNQKLPSAQSNDAAVTQNEEAKSTESPSASVVDNKVEVVEKAVEPAPTVADVPASAPASTPADDAKVNDDVAHADDKPNAPAKDAVSVNDANSKPQEAANGTKQTSDAIPAIKIDEANENEKKTEKLVASNDEPSVTAPATQTIASA